MVSDTVLRGWLLHGHRLAFIRILYHDASYRLLQTYAIVLEFVFEA